MQAELIVGPKSLSDGSLVTGRTDKTAALMTSDAHGRFLEAAYRNTLFSGGMTLTSISNATFTTSTLTASATPILGVWNPAASGKNLVILQAKLQVIVTALQVTGAGAFMWASSLGNAGLTLGSAPFNRGTGAATGSVAKDMSGIALTGLTTTLVVRDASGLQGGPTLNLSTLQTAAGLMPPALVAVDNVDGSIIVPPGGILALLTTSTGVAISAASSIMWEETAI